MQKEVLVLKESLEEPKQVALVFFVGQKAVNNWIERLAEVKMEVFQQDVFLFTNCIAEVNLFEYAHAFLAGLYPGLRGVAK